MVDQVVDINLHSKKKDYEKKDDRFCTHCNVGGHVKESCFRLFGYPEWYKDFKQRKGRQQFNITANMVDTPMSDTSQKAHED